MKTIARFGALYLFSVALHAGSLAGIIRDPAGRAIPRAQVTVHPRDGRSAVTARTTADGRYRIASLPDGDYLLEAASAGLATTICDVRVAGDTRDGDLTLPLAEVHGEIVVTATGSPQSSDEVAKAVDTIDAGTIDRKQLSSVLDALAGEPGVRWQQQGGPGAFTRVVIRGMRAHDTSITLDGLRLRDPSTTQGDASTFLESLNLVNLSRAELLRGCGSSVYGSNAIAGVVNLVTGTGGGATHGEWMAEGGGLGFARSYLRGAGGFASNRLTWSGGLAHTNMTAGVDPSDHYRNSSAQGALRWQPSARTSLLARLWADDVFAQINDTPFVAPSALLPARGAIVAQPVSIAAQRAYEAGGAIDWTSGNLMPALNDPDSRRGSRFGTGALVFQHALTPSLDWRASYQFFTARRKTFDGPAGVRFEPRGTVRDRFNGDTHTADVRATWRAARWNAVSGGYEFEREGFFSDHVEAAGGNSARVRQNSHSLYFHDQLRLLSERLQISLSGRYQGFDLSAPRFSGLSTFDGAAFPSPRAARTGDAAVAYFIAKTGTKFRAHLGNGYRAPSLYERLGASFFNGSFSALGDPRLRPERAVSVDGGVDQYLLRQRVRLSATWFYTNLQETVGFDFSGLIDPATDPYRRGFGYLNLGGAVARGGEFSAEISPWRGARLRPAYTYVNSDQKRSIVRDNDFFRTLIVPDHQFSVAASQQIGPVIVTADYWGASRHPMVYSSRAFLFDGARKLDLGASYTRALTDRQSVRIFARLANALDSRYLESGYRTPGRWGLGGVAWQF